MQLTSVYYGMTYFFELRPDTTSSMAVVVSSMAVVVFMLQAGAGVNNVCCFARPLINGRYCLH